MPGTVSDVRNDITKTHAVVSEVQRDVADTHAMVSDIRRSLLKSLEEVDDQRWPGSDTPTIPTIKRTLNIAQAQARLANLTADGSNILYLHLEPLVNHLPRRRGPVSDVTS